MRDHDLPKANNAVVATSLTRRARPRRSAMKVIQSNSDLKRNRWLAGITVAIQIVLLIGLYFYETVARARYTEVRDALIDKVMAVDGFDNRELLDLVIAGDDVHIWTLMSLSLAIMGLILIIGPIIVSMFPVFNPDGAADDAEAQPHRSRTNRVS